MGGKSEGNQHQQKQALPQQRREMDRNGLLKRNFRRMPRTGESAPEGEERGKRLFGLAMDLGQLSVATINSSASGGRRMNKRGSIHQTRLAVFVAIHLPGPWIDPPTTHPPTLFHMNKCRSPPPHPNTFLYSTFDWFLPTFLWNKYESK
jgi:hypothetical protein